MTIGLRDALLQAAVQGKLTEREPGDEPAKDLLERIRAERAQLVKEKKAKGPKGGESVIERRPDGTVWEKRGKGDWADITDEIPFDIPDEWEWARLISMIDDTRSGKSPQCSERAAVDGEYGVLKTTAVQSCSYQPTANKVLPTGFTVDEKWVPKVGDVLVTRAGPKSRTGIGCVVTEKADVILSDKIIAFHPIISSISSDYVACCINSQGVRDLIEGMMTGMSASQVNISQSNLKELLLPLPCHEEQQRIVAKLEELLPKAERAEALDAERMELTKRFPDTMHASILQAAVQGELTERDANDEPVSELLERIRSERKELVKKKLAKAPKGGESAIERRADGSVWEKRGKGDWVDITDEVPFDIPDEWEWARISSVAISVRGSGIKKTEVTKAGEPCVRYGELYTTYDHEVREVRSHTSDGVYGSAKKLHIGEVLMTLTGENNIDIGRAVVNETGRTIAYGGDLLALTGQWVDGRFLMYAVNSDYIGKQRTAAATGDIIVHLSAAKIDDFLIAVPPAQEQRRIVAKLEQMLPMVERLSDKVAKDAA